MALNAARRHRSPKFRRHSPTVGNDNSHLTRDVRVTGALSRPQRDSGARRLLLSPRRRWQHGLATGLPVRDDHAAQRDKYIEREDRRQPSVRCRTWRADDLVVVRSEALGRDHNLL